MGNMKFPMLKRKYDAPSWKNYTPNYIPMLDDDLQARHLIINFNLIPLSGD